MQTQYIVPEGVWVDVQSSAVGGWTLEQTRQRLTFPEPDEIVPTPAGELWLFRVGAWRVRVPVTKLLVMNDGVVSPLLSPERTGGIVRQDRPSRRERAPRVSKTPGYKRGEWKR